MLTENTRGALKICEDFGGTSAEGASGAPTIFADFGVRVFFAGPCKSISRQKHGHEATPTRGDGARPRRRARVLTHRFGKTELHTVGHRGGQYYPPGVQLCNSVSCRAAGHHGPGNFGHKPKHPPPTQLTLPPHHHVPLPASSCASSTAQCHSRATRAGPTTAAHPRAVRGLCGSASAPASP